MRYLLALTACLGFTAQAADLSSIKSVYLMPMSRGLDQYLAQTLSASGRFSVVTDPSKADAFFTDRIGSNFEEMLSELLEPKNMVEKKDDPNAPTAYQRPAMQPLSRGKGNVFLVGRANHTIIWSAYAPAKTSDTAELSRIAKQLAEKLK